MTRPPLHDVCLEAVTRNGRVRASRRRRLLLLFIAVDDRTSWTTTSVVARLTEEWIVGEILTQRKSHARTQRKEAPEACG